MTALASPRGNVSLYSRLLIMAWAIEIIAASIGLALALSRLIPTGDEELPLFMAFQGAIPFFAVMIIELTKIPLASVFYTVGKLRWRVLFFCSLALTMVITFETFFIGFEQYQSLLMRPLQGITTQIAEQKRIIAGSSRQQDASTTFSENREATTQASRDNENSINEKFDKQEKERIRQKNEIQKKYDVKAGPIKSELRRVDIDLAALDKRYASKLDRIQAERAEATLSASANKNTEAEHYLVRLETLQQQKQQIRADATKRRNQIVESSGKELEACTFCDDERQRRKDDLAKVEQDERLTLSKIELQEREINNQLSGNTSNTSNIRNVFSKAEGSAKQTYDADKLGLLDERSRLTRQLANATGDMSTTDKREFDLLNTELSKISKQRQLELNHEKGRYDRQQQTFDDQSSKAAEALNTVAEARKVMIPLCTVLNDKVAENQIFRLAMQLYGSNDACALEEEQLSFTKAIWFGSLAIIVSVLGTILALAAFVVRHPPVSSSRPLGKRLRFCLLSIRKRMNKPRVVTETVEVEKIVEVVKEIPVDKIVFKEVPVEIVKREVVHIPVYTNDPSLLGKKFKAHNEQ